MATREPRLCAPPPSSHFDLSRARPNNARSPSSPRLVLAPLVVTVHVGAPVDAANHDGRVSIARPSPPLSASSAETDSTRSRTCRTSCSVRRPSGSGSACRTRATSRTLSGSRLRRFTSRVAGQRCVRRKKGEGSKGSAPPVVSTFFQLSAPPMTSSTCLRFRYVRSMYCSTRRREAVSRERERGEGSARVSSTRRSQRAKTRTRLLSGYS